MPMSREHEFDTAAAFPLSPRRHAQIRVSLPDRACGRRRAGHLFWGGDEACGSERRVTPATRGGAAATMTHFDAIVIGTGQSGPSLAVRLANAGKKRRDHRAQALRRHVRQQRLYPDQDADRERPRGAVARRAADFGVDDRRDDPGGHEGGQGAQGRDRARASEGVENGCAAPRASPSNGHARFVAPEPVASASELLEARADLHQRRRPRRRPGHAGHRRRCPTSPTRR